MTEAIINYLNLKLETVGRLGVIHCLAELRSDGTTNVPYVYSGTGQVVPVNIDGGNLSYWRMDNPISFEPIVGNYGVKQLTGTYDLRLVIVARRKDSTVDDAYMPTRLAEDVANQITGSFPDLKLLLKAQSVNIRVNSIDTNIPKVWGEEFTGTQVNDLNYTRAIMALSVSVTVTGSRECWQNECDIDPDILHIFNFCDPNTVDRLTSEQLTCLGDALCTPVGVTVNNVPYATEPAGGSVNVPVQQGGVDVGSLVAGVWVIPPAPACADGDIELNGTPVATVPSGETEDIDVVNGGSNPVGAWDGTSWVIGNNATYINAVQVTDQEAEVNASIFVTRDGVQSGTWNAGTQTWEVTSAACSPVTFQINAVNKESIASGATFNLITKLDGVVNNGSYDAPTDTLSFTSAVPTPKTTAFPLKSGETVSYGVGSDGNIGSGRGTSWLVMAENNMFGNTNRFTDTLGGTAYANNIVLDHQSRDPLTGNLIGYDRADVVTARTFANHLTYFAAKTNSGFGSWRGTNYQELHQISRWGGINFKWSNAPFLYTGAGTGDYLWTTTTNNIVTTDAWLVFNYSTVPVQARDKGGSYFMMGCRTFTLTNGGVLS